jgi:hypothetical protein
MQEQDRAWERAILIAGAVTYYVRVHADVEDHGAGCRLPALAQ